MLASAVLARVVDVLQDTTNVRWVEDELLRWLSDGQREIVAARPEANVKNEPVTLTANNSRQSLPSGGLCLLDIVRNLGANGTTYGRAIRVVAREILDAQIPDWHTSVASSEIVHFVFDKRDPKTFYVYPRPNDALQVEAIFQAVPANVTQASDELDLPDVYMSPLVDYVLYRAYSKDSEYAGNSERAKMHYQAAANSIGLMTQVEQAYSPNANSVLNPNFPVKPAAT